MARGRHRKSRVANRHETSDVPRVSVSPPDADKHDEATAVFPLENRSPSRPVRSWWLLLTTGCVAVAVIAVWTISYLRRGGPSVELPQRQAWPLSKSDNSSTGVRDPAEAKDPPQPPVAGSAESQHSSRDKQPDTAVFQPDKPPADRITVVLAEIRAVQKESIEIAETLIREFPNEADPLGLLGMVYDRMDQTSKAMEYWSKALERDPNRADLCDAMATIALRKGDHKKALELCRQGLQKRDLAVLHYHLAEALKGLGRMEESLPQSEAAVKSAPAAADFYCQLGSTFALLHQHEKAKVNYEMAVKLQPGHQTAYYGLAMACAKLSLDDQYRRAIEQFEKLKAADRRGQREQRDVAYEMEWAHHVLAMACCGAAAVYIGENQPKKAEPLLRRGRAVEANNVACRLQLAQLLVKDKRVAEATAIMEELVAIQPQNANFRLRLAIDYARLNRLDAAREAAQKSLELAPGNEDCRRFLGQLQAKKVNP